MALPTDTTNDTDQFDTHPALHNDVNTRVNALDAQVITEDGTGNTGLRLQTLDAAGELRLQSDDMVRRLYDGTGIGPLLQLGQIQENDSSVPLAIADTSNAWTPISASGTLSVNARHPGAGALCYVEAVAAVQFLTSGTSGDIGGGTVELSAFLGTAGSPDIWLSLLHKDRINEWAVDRNVSHVLKAVGLIKAPSGESLLQFNLRYRSSGIVGIAANRQFLYHGIRVTELVL